jgi:hypothetical protein
MKKILFIFLSLIVFSCGKDELVFDLNASGDLSEQTIEQAKKTIYGKWDFGNSSKASRSGKKNSPVTNSIFGKRYVRNNSKSSGQGKNLSCAFNFIEFNDNTYIMAIISDGRTEYLSGDYVINENSDKKVTSVDLKLKLGLEEITIATLTDIIVVKTGSNLDATWNISLNFPDDADFASCNSLSGSVSVEKAEPLEGVSLATSDNIYTKLIKTWNFDSYVEYDYQESTNYPIKADKLGSWNTSQLWLTENLVPKILEEFCLDSERISPTNKEIVNPNCTAPTNMSITFSTYGTYTFFYSGGSDGIVIDEIDSWDYLNLPDPKSNDPDDFYETFEIVIGGKNLLYDFKNNYQFMDSRFDELRYLIIESLTDDTLEIRIDQTVFPYDPEVTDPYVEGETEGTFYRPCNGCYYIQRLYKFSAAQ